VHEDIRGTDANVAGQTMGWLGAQRPAGAIGRVHDPLLHTAVSSHVGSGLVPHSHVSPLSEHGARFVGGVVGHGSAGDPLLLLKPPELDPLPLVLPPELDPLVLPLDPPPLLLPLPLDPPPLPLPELDPSPSPGSAVKVAPPQATTAREVERAAKTPRRQERRGGADCIVARDRAHFVPRATFGNWLILRCERRAPMCHGLPPGDRNDTAGNRDPPGLRIAILRQLAILRPGTAILDPGLSCHPSG
jgi:hypothetical protein